LNIEICLHILVHIGGLAISQQFCTYHTGRLRGKWGGNPPPIQTRCLYTVTLDWIGLSKV